MSPARVYPGEPERAGRDAPVPELEPEAPVECLACQLGCGVKALSRRGTICGGRGNEKAAAPAAGQHRAGKRPQDAGPEGDVAGGPFFDSGGGGLGEQAFERGMLEVSQPFRLAPKGFAAELREILGMCQKSGGLSLSAAGEKGFFRVEPGAGGCVRDLLDGDPR